MGGHLRTLLGGAGIRIAVYLTGILIGIFLTPYLLRTLGDREYAVFVFAGLFTNWCGLADFGLTTASARFITLRYTRGETGKVNETANTAGVLFALTGLVVLAAAAIVSLVFRYGVHTPEAPLCASVFLIAGAAFALSKLSDAVSGVMNGVMRTDLTGAAAFLYRVFLGLFTFLAVWMGGHVTAAVAGQFAAAALNLLLLALLVRKAFPPFRFSPRLFRKERAGELFRYSVYTFGSQLGNLLVRRSDLAVIGAFLTLTDVTCYNLAVVTFISYFLTFLEEIANWETNWFTHLIQLGEKARFEKSKQVSYKAMTYLTVLMALFLIFWAGDFIRFWVGEEYLDAFNCLVLLAGGMAFYRGSAEVNVRLLQGMARHQPLAWLAVLQGVLTVGLSVLAVKAGFGKIGVAAGTLIPDFLVHGITVPLLVCRLTKASFPAYVLRMLFYTGTAVFAFVPSLILFRFFLAPSLLRLASVGLAALLLWLAAIWYAGFSRDERNAAVHLLRYKRD